MGEDENLEMSLFDSADNLELNLDETPADYTGSFDGNEQDNNIPSDDLEFPGQENVAEENEPEEDDSANADDDANNSTSPSMYSSFANLLHEEGLLSSLDSNTEIKSIADIKSLVEAEIEMKVESKFSSEELEDLRALRNGVSPSELAQHHALQNQLSSIGAEHIEGNPELRKQLIYQDYVNQGLSEAKALKLVNRSVDLEQDGEDAIEALESIKSFEAHKLEEQQAQRKIEAEQADARYAAEQAKLKDSIYAKEEIIKGQKLTKVLKDRVYNSMTNVIGNSPEGVPENALMRDRRENPIEFDSKLYYLYEITKGFKDFTILNKTATSTASNELEQALRSSNFIQDSGMPNYLLDDNSYDGGFGNEIVF